MFDHEKCTIESTLEFSMICNKNSSLCSYIVKAGKAVNGVRDQEIMALYQAHAGTVYRFLFCLTRDHHLSEELTQETFYLAIKSVRSFRGQCKLNVWLCQIAKRLWYKELKRKKRIRFIPLEDEPLISQQDVERDFIRQSETDELRQRIHMLDENTRKVMLLRLTGDMSFEEIGDLTGHSAVWARVTFYRGKEKIAKEWNRDE